MARRRTVSLLLSLSLGFLPACSDLTGNRDRHIAWFHADPTGAAGEPYVDSSLAVFTSFKDMRVIALDASSGQLRWQTSLPQVAGVPYTGMPIGGSVVAYQDLIIVAAWDVYALDRRSGAVRWSFTQTDDYPGYNSLVVADGTVYSGGRDLYALDAATGALKYRRSLGEQPFRPVVIDTVIYVATRREVLPGVLGNGHVMALGAASGATIWSVAIDDPRDSVRGGSVGPVSSTDSMIVVAGMNGVVYALDRATGQSRWTHTDTTSYEAGLAIVGNAVIVAGDDGVVEGVSLFTGAPLWRTGPGSSVLERITVGDQVALVSVGALFAYDSAGRQRWQSGGAGWGGPVYGTAARLKNGLVYIGSADPEGGGPGAGFYALRAP